MNVFRLIQELTFYYTYCMSSYFSQSSRGLLHCFIYRILYTNFVNVCCDSRGKMKLEKYGVNNSHKQM